MTDATRPHVALALALAALLPACGGRPDEPARPPTTAPAPPAAPPAAPAAAPTDGVGVLSNGGTWYVVYRPDPDSIPLNEPFGLSVAVFDGADRTRLRPDVELAVDGRMPDHRHGMNREPAIVRRDDGTFAVTGLLFHMPGFWELHFDVTSDGVTERAQVGVELE